MNGLNQLSLKADESEMIVCYTRSTTNNEETAEGNVDETEENDNTEQDEQRVDIVEYKTVDEQEANDKIDELRIRCINQQSKMATRIVSSLLNKFFSLSEKKDSESNLIIETLRPFLMNIITSPCAYVEFEWMTYRMASYNNDGQLIIPDLVLYITLLSNINFELFVVEVKKHGNFSNGSLENDMIKLGKEMKLPLDKMVAYKVDSPEVISLLIRGSKATVMKMDLLYNGQYRLIEISNFFIVRDTVEDIMLIPGIIQKLDQARQMIQNTIEKVYKAIRKEVSSTQDNNTFMRKVCQSPITVKKEYGIKALNCKT
ncbi:hypothetical protein G6F43_012143 [Rhizopus delemar]|nr:hypothetical protein G6F43_012143 [Rhizopus delemar]